jgi:hypothetical protein
MKGGGGEFSTGTMGNFQPELTNLRVGEKKSIRVLHPID